VPILGSGPGDPFGIIDRVKEVDPDLFVAWNPNLWRFEVHDRRAPGEETMVMRVQEPDGRFRMLDNRVLETLRANRRERFPEILREVERVEEEREKRWESDLESLAHGVADELKFAGKVVVQGVNTLEPGSVESKGQKRDS